MDKEIVFTSNIVYNISLENKITLAFRTQEALLDFVEHALDGGVKEIHITQHAFTKKEEQS